MVRAYRIYPKKRKNILSGLSINTWIISINVILFVLLSILFRNQLFIENGFVWGNIALSLGNIQALKLWTFLTSMFMHGGFFHLFVNMISLFFIGSLIEKMLGPKRYLSFYLISGLIAGGFYILAEFLFSANPLPAVGASGALFGLVGLLVLLTPNLPVYVMFIPIPIKIKYAAIGLLAALWIISATTGLGIGNTAHLGGLIAGLGYGLYLKNKFPQKTHMLKRHFS